MQVFLMCHSKAKTPPFLFTTLAASFVSHPRGWGRSRVRLTSRKRDADCTIMLTPSSVMDAMFPQFQADQLSACNMKTREIWIREERWNRDIPDRSCMSLVEYRCYLIQHELGHALGLDHPPPPPPPPSSTPTSTKRVVASPVMVQQTLGVHPGFSPNPFPTELEKRQVSFGQTKKKK